VIRTVRFKVSPRVVLVALAAASALAVDAWKDWDAAHRAPPAHSAVSAERLADVAVGLDPAMLAIARRHDPALRSPDLWGRPLGWTNLDMTGAPDLGLARADAETAREVNALRPFARLPIRPMRPFELALSTPDGARALQCLTQAVYYEAAREPLQGQEAVAQVVLNRLRHPAYPKSVCGVVFQGSGRATGCQFTFTCDGSLRYAPQPALWARAQKVARQALAGFVMREVGSATHYHADYVSPYWAPTLVKLRQVGAHIFYRWTGPWGEPPAFTGRYGGGESALSLAVLQGEDPRFRGLLAPEQQGVLEGRTFTLAVAGEVRTYTKSDPKAADGEKTRVFGTIYTPRRQPTPEEVKAINASLADLEAKLAEKSKAAAASAQAGAAP
jgi:hypothetical protein